MNHFIYSVEKERARERIASRSYIANVTHLY